MDFYESQDTDVVLSCPYCREEIDSEPTFERTLDELISKKINLVRNCEAKVDWSARRTQYTQHLKILKDTREQEKEVEDELSAYEKILAVVMPSVCIILMLIVVFARRSAFR
jgi:predicted ribosome quality control (RQC) complex YloA/Tae2 family protein